MSKANEGFRAPNKLVPLARPREHPNKHIIFIYEMMFHRGAKMKQYKTNGQLTYIAMKKFKRFLQPFTLWHKGHIRPGYRPEQLCWNG